MDTDFMERMAREYNKQLQNCTGVGDTALLETSIDIVERQLDLIVAALSCNKQCNKALSYLESLKRQTLRDLNALLGRVEVPSYRPKVRSINDMFNRLVDLQIELFINLDHLKERDIAADDIILNETRALGIMGVMR